MSNSKEQLYGIFAKSLEIPIETVNDELAYQEIVEWDSMSQVVLISDLETAYNISIKLEDVLEMRSVKAVKEILKKYGLEFQ